MSKPTVSEAFRLFTEQAPQHAEAWMKAAEQLAEASALDAKTRELAYHGAGGLADGKRRAVSRDAGETGRATREEVISTLFIGLPAAGTGVTSALPAALEAYNGGVAAVAASRIEVQEWTTLTISAFRPSV